MQRLALQRPQGFSMVTELELHSYLLRRFIRQDGPQANTSVGALSIHAPVQEADHVLGFRKQTFQTSPRLKNVSASSGSRRIASVRSLIAL